MAGNVYVYRGDWRTDTNEPDQGLPPGQPPVIGYDRNPFLITIGLWENDVSLPGSFNTAVGSQAGAVRTTGDRNIDIGYQSGPAVDFDGSDNISIGYLAGSAKTAGDDNIYIGNNGSSLTTESDTIRIGTEGVHANSYIAGMLTVGQNPNPIDFPITNGGQENTVMGRNAMSGLTGSVATTRSMVVIGYAAYRVCSGAFRDTVVGGRAGSNIVFGGANTLIGYEAGSIGPTPTSGIQATICIGDSCGVQLASGTTGNILIGNSGAAVHLVNSGNNQIRIGSAIHFETRLYGQLYLE